MVTEAFHVHVDLDVGARTTHYVTVDATKERSSQVHARAIDQVVESLNGQTQYGLA